MRSISVAALACLLAACSTGRAQHESPASTWAPDVAEAAVSDVAADAIQVLDARDMKALAALVHPGRGVRLSPYAFVEPEHVVLEADAIEGAWADTTPRTWGSYDGSGEPIDRTFQQYFDRFVYDADFLSAATVGFNTRLSSGNSLDNAAEVYPDGVIVEYYIAGVKAQYEGMDWRSLKLVFERADGGSETWYLVAIVHDEWTI